MNIKEILEALKRKYPESNDGWNFPSIVLFDDGSGRIVKEILDDVYMEENLLFNFSSIEELVEHLQ